MNTEVLQLKQGVQVKLAHFADEPLDILSVALKTAPDTYDGILWVTEGYREERHERDLHTWCRAFDFRIRNFMVAPGTDDEEYARKIITAWGWVVAMRAEHSDGRFQFDVHGEDANVHVHAEFDPR